MKKIASFLIVLITILSLSACRNQANEPAPETTQAIVETTAAAETEAAESETPEEETTVPETTEPETTVPETTAAETTEAPTEKASKQDGVTPAFKEAMDSYEAFFDEYVEFMDSYDATNIGMLLDYTNLMTKYMDTMSKLDQMQDEATTDADLAYYIEVMARIEKKLLSVAQ